MPPQEEVEGRLCRPGEICPVRRRWLVDPQQIGISAAVRLNSRYHLRHPGCRGCDYELNRAQVPQTQLGKRGQHKHRRHPARPWSCRTYGHRVVKALGTASIQDLKDVLPVCSRHAGFKLRGRKSCNICNARFTFRRGCLQARCFCWARSQRARGTPSGCQTKTGRGRGGARMKILKGYYD